MNSLVLPRTALRVSRLCLGTADFGAGISEKESFALLDQFFEAGGNFLDTAAIYADWTPAGKGSSEKLIGKWLKSRSNSASNPAVVATKGGHPELDAMGVGRLAKSEVERDLTASLRHLGRDSVDLYYLHRDDESVPVEAVLEMLEGFVAAGKIRFYGCSNWKTARIEAFQTAAQTRGASGFVANQPMWALAEADLSGGDPTMVAMDAGMRQYHARSGLAAIPYSSQANGYFSKLRDGRAVPTIYQTDAVRALNRTRFERAQTLASETGLSLTQIALGYLLCQPFPTVPIIGCKNAAQLNDSLSAAETKLSPSQLAHLMNF